MRANVTPGFVGALEAKAHAVARDILVEATEIVTEAVERHRGRGMAEAYYRASCELGVAERRVRQFWHGEVGADAVKAWEIEMFRLAQRCARQKEMAEDDRRSAAARARLGEGLRAESAARGSRMGDGPCRLVRA